MAAIEDAPATMIWSKPGNSDAPPNLVRLSEEGGHDVSFSGDGSYVFWLYGIYQFVIREAHANLSRSGALLCFC